MSRQFTFMEVLARWVSRYAGWITSALVVLLVLCGVYSANLGNRLSGGGWTVPGSEEAQAERAQEAGFVGRGSSSVILLVHDDRFSASSTEFAPRVAGVIQQITADPRLQIRSQAGWNPQSPSQQPEFLGRDARTTLTTLELGIDDGAAKRILPEVEREFSKFNAAGLRAYLVGQSAAFAATTEVGATALSRVEVILLPLVVMILIVLYRSVAAALISLVVSVTAIIVAMGVLTWLADAVDLNVVVQSIATMLGLGVGVDYSLIMIRRFVDELSGADPALALTNTMRTAGRTVGASGATVATALATLLVVDMPVIRSMAVAAIVVVVAAVLACLVALPAVLHLLGTRVVAWRIPWLPSSRERGQRRWGRFARAIMARPVTALAITSATLLASAAPALGLQTGTGDASVLPKSSSVRAGYDLVEEQYGKGAVEPISVIIRASRPFSGSDDFRRVAAMTVGFGQLDHVARVDSPIAILDAVTSDNTFAALEGANFNHLPVDAKSTISHFVSADRKTIAIDIFSNERAADPRVKTLVSQVRSVATRNAAPDWKISVGGLAPVLFSANQQISDASPIVIAAMLTVIYLLLVLTFRSLLLPLKAIALNLLSVGAAMGVLVLIFQHGFLADALGIASVGPIQNFVPILLVAVLFSLSTDYEVFLLSRVRERYEQTQDNTESVVYGLVETAPLISGAALLMVTIFAAFLAVPLVTVQQMGLAAAIAIAIDATIVRLVMVPAAMRLMGRWNWWMPRRITRNRNMTRRQQDCNPEQIDDAGAQWVP